MTSGLAANVPLSIVVIAMVVAFTVAAQAGHLIGRRLRARGGAEGKEELGTSLGGLLGLLGLLLAFTFSMAGERFERRKNLVVEEANAIGTAWLRADLVPEPMRTRSRSELRDYTQLRLDAAAAKGMEERLQLLARSERIQATLWTAAVEAAAASPTPPTALFVAAVNELIDAHGRRVFSAVRNPIPPAILDTVLGVALLVLAAMGFSRGLDGSRSAAPTIALSLVVTVVLALILDLDRPSEGYLRVSQQAMQDVRAMMGP
jgi:hypothetical protein